MYELKTNGKVFRSESVGTGPSSCEIRIYRAAVSQGLRNIGLEDNIKMDLFILILFLLFKILILLNYN